MKRSVFSKLFLVATIVLTQTSALSSATGAPFPGVGKRNTVKSNGFELTVNWCHVATDRTAECDVTAVSLTQDFKAGFAYPIMQDQSGAQFRMVPKDRTLGQYVMIAGEPYNIRYINKDKLPTTVERVRGLVGTWALWNLQGIKAGEFPVTFADIPARPAPKPATLQIPANQGQAKAPNKNQPTPEKMTIWETVGFWTYDAQDGMRVPEGLELVNAPGALGVYSWKRRLQLKTHDQLAPRADRILWPVFLNRRARRVCVDAPYPSFHGYIDLEGEEDDGVYAFASCKGPNA